MLEPNNSQNALVDADKDSRGMRGLVGIGAVVALLVSLMAIASSVLDASALTEVHAESLAAYDAARASLSLQNSALADAVADADSNMVSLDGVDTRPATVSKVDRDAMPSVLDEETGEVERAASAVVARRQAVYDAAIKAKAARRQARLDAAKTELSGEMASLSAALDRAHSVSGTVDAVSTGQKALEAGRKSSSETNPWYADEVSGSAQACRDAETKIESVIKLATVIATATVTTPAQGSDGVWHMRARTDMWTVTAAPDGALTQWAPGYYIAHNWSRYGKLIASLPARVEIGGAVYARDASRIMSRETWWASDLEPFVRAKSGAIGFQTCDDASGGYLVARYVPVG